MLIIEFHKVLKKVPTDKLDALVMNTIQENHVLGGVVERVILDILAIEKQYRLNKECVASTLC